MSQNSYRATVYQPTDATEQGNQPTQQSWKKGDLLTVTEVARILRVDDTTVRRWIKQDALDAVVLPHVNKRAAYRVKWEALDAILTTTFNPQAVE